MKILKQKPIVEVPHGRFDRIPTHGVCIYRNNLGERPCRNHVDYWLINRGLGHWVCEDHLEWGLEYFENNFYVRRRR